ncbi:unnamed protein product [Plutella xylostella]|uniref:(diamondback moth) hypothetical protein n=1 Tax=Plutella xylostella TaxID=51655 RepID=A0A8S4G5Y8_PLUXY|nr:unnamed protein product [Plutella xylostella]
MAVDEDDSTWLIELESALLDGCSAQEINLLTKGKKIPESLRPDVWLLCLRCHDAGNQLIMFDEIFDLPNQSELRDQVRKFVKKLGNDEDDKLAVASDLESIMTFYCKSKDDVLELLFSDCELEINSKLYSQALCLPVAVHELVESATVDAALDVESIKFFLVDCRPAEQYNAGHLSTAFHLDCNLMLQEPNAFNTAVQGLLNAQRQALAAGSLAAGEHLCFVGSGRTEEDSYAHMVVASFLKKNTKHVSMLDGGFVAIHDYFGAHMTDCLEEHNPQACLVCAPSNNNNSPMNMQVRSRENIPSVQLFSKLSSAMKAKSQEVKGKLIDYIVNPTATTGNGEWHVSANDKKDRRYRNVPPVFSINDEEDESKLELRRDVTDSNSNEEIVDINKFLKELNVVNSFQCQEVLLNGYMLDSFLVVTETHLVILREIPNKQGVAKVMARRPLSTIVKITAKKRHPELITFKYGVPDGDNLLIKDMNRFLIPNAAAATKLVSNQIVQQLDNKS